LGFAGLLYSPWGVVLQVVAILHFIRRRPEGYWLWIILIGGGLGSLIYIVAEVLPDVDLLRGFANRVSRRGRVRALEAMVRESAAVGHREELADLYLEDGQYAKARALYDSVIATRVDTPDPYYRRALAALGLNEPAAAIPDLEHVVARERKYDFHRALGLLGHAHAQAGNPTRAGELFEDATTISTLSETYYNYATFLAGQGRPAEAREWAQRILAKKPTMPRYLRRRERPWFRKAKALIKRLGA
jgi:hypothetical protein